MAGYKFSFKTNESEKRYEYFNFELYHKKLKNEWILFLLRLLANLKVLHTLVRMLCSVHSYSVTRPFHYGLLIKKDSLFCLFFPSNLWYVGN